MMSSNAPWHVSEHSMGSVTPSQRPLLQRRNSLSNTFQALVDGMIVIALVAGLAIWLNGVITMQYVVMTLTLLGAMAVVYDRMGIYRRNVMMTEKVVSLGRAWAVSIAIVLAIAFSTKTSEDFSRLIFGILLVAGYLLQVLSHLAFRYVQARSIAQQDTVNALVIGTGDLAGYITTRINGNPWISERVIGCVSLDDRSGDESRAAPHVDGSYPEILGGLQDVRSLVARNDIRTVYITVPLQISPGIAEVYQELIDANVDVHWAPDIYALNLVNHSVKEFAGIPIITLSETPLMGTHHLFKSIEDKVLATVALILASPIMLVTAIAIKLESRGPVFFRQARTGWDGKEFKIWKFRSMRVHEPRNGDVQQATKDDPRVTRVGRFIRRTSIDELPQFFNVLSGQMSMVGPRPHAVQHNEEYAKRINAYLARHRIKPGITGLAQVRGFRGETAELEAMEMRVRCDMEYINNWSVWLDLTILARTAFTLLGKNAY